MIREVGIGNFSLENSFVPMYFGYGKGTETLLRDSIFEFDYSFDCSRAPVKSPDDYFISSIVFRLPGIRDDVGFAVGCLMYIHLIALLITGSDCAVFLR